MTQKKETFEFQAEVSRLLEIVTHSLYSQKEIFLRELLSNAADACDKRRYVALTDKNILAPEAYKITITLDKKKNTLTISDNGIGMSREDLIDNLGTIARSGTSKFLEQLKAKKEADMNLIGQFGVGFYAAFMVADKVEVTTRKAGETEAHHWTSTGMGKFDIILAEKKEPGTDIVVHLKKGCEEYTDVSRIEYIVKTYSDYVAIPIELVEEKDKVKQINEASALWTRPKNEITEKQYEEFYHHVAGAFDKPWGTLHYKVEGILEYTALLFLPEQRPFDLFDPERKSKLKLFIKKVFITDNCEALLPGYLRFVRGVVDANDLPLNVSREMLQHEPRLAKMKTGITKKVLGLLSEQCKKERERYAKFWQTFGAVLKEGIYEDQTNREELLGLGLFYSMKHNKEITLEAYMADMPAHQKAIYYLTGKNLDLLKNSPQIEQFKDKGIDVLLLADPVDEYWTGAVSTFKEKDFTSAASDVDLEAAETKEGEKKKDEKAADLGALGKFLKELLKDQIKDVRVSKRLKNSPACLATDGPSLPPHFAAMMGAEHAHMLAQSRILEVNPQHALVQQLEKLSQDKKSFQKAEDLGWILYDQALLAEGELVKDPAKMTERLTRLLG